MDILNIKVLFTDKGFKILDPEHRKIFYDYCIRSKGQFGFISVDKGYPHHIEIDDTGKQIIHRSHSAIVSTSYEVTKASQNHQ